MSTRLPKLVKDGGTQQTQVVWDEPPTQDTPIEEMGEAKEVENNNNNNTGNDTEAIVKLPEPVELPTPPANDTLKSSKPPRLLPPIAKRRKLQFQRVSKKVVVALRWVTGSYAQVNEGDDVESNSTGQQDSSTRDPFLQKFIADNTEEQDVVDLSNASRSKKLWIFLKTFVINPSLSNYYYWSMLVSLAFLYNMILVIARFTFQELQDGFEDIWLTIDYVADAIYIFDTFLESRKAYLEQGLLVVDVKLLTQRYVRSNAFVLDILSIIPSDLLYFAFSMRQPLVRINRILRFHRLTEFADRMETRTSWPNLFRLVKLIGSLLILFHWNGCVFYNLSKMAHSIENDSCLSNDECDDSWAFSYGKIINPLVKGFLPGSEGEWENISDPNAPDYEKPFTNLSRQYLLSFYWSALTLMAIGEQNPPVKNWQFIFHTVDILFGLLVVATIVGNVGEMISNMSAAEAEFQERLDGVKMFMKYRSVKPNLESRVVKWFNHIWSQKQSLDEESVTAMLPTKLKGELAIAVHLETLKRVKIFQDCEAGVLVELVLKLKLQIFSPGDYVCRKGDVGKEMYIVKKGNLNVVGDDGIKVFVTLKEGSVFGELSVLNIPGNKTGNKRTASVRSVGYSDLFVLSKDDLWDALREYPEAKQLLLQKGREILMKDGLIDTSVTTEEITRESLEQKLKRVETELGRLECSFDQLFCEFDGNTQTLKSRVTKLESTAKDRKKSIQKEIFLNYTKRLADRDKKSSFYQ